MKNFVLILATIFFVNNLSAQRSVTGVIMDSANKFESATVVLYKLMDSSVVSTTTTNKVGEFTFKNLDTGAYRLYITSVQFISTVKDFRINNNTVLKDMGVITVVKGRQLEDAVVTAQNPIRIANDTVEYRADAFKTRPNAVVEDLLKKLPGVEVDKNGNIKAYGQQVQKVLVDGKEFFGNDPKTATKNLPANIVDKVQVLDKKSDQAQFTGFDDGQTEKVINLTIKKDKKKGFFGRGNIGYGTDDRYESNLSFNRFNNGMQLSAIGQANNINQEGFSFQDMMDFNGNGGFRNGDAENGSGGMFGGGGAGVMMIRGSGGTFGGMNFGGLPTGRKNTLAGGLNFANSYGKKLVMNGSYFYNRSATTTITESVRETFTGNPLFNNTNTQNGTKEEIRANHRFNFNIDWNIDSANSILFRPSVTVVDKNYFNDNSTIIANNVKTPITQIEQNNSDQQTQLNLTGTILWRHKTSKKGRTLSVRLNGGKNQTDGEGDILNEQLTLIGINPNYQLQDQINQTNNFGNTYNARVTYTEPITKTRILETFVVVGGNLNNSDRKTFSKSSTGVYNVLDSVQSNVFENQFNSQQVGFNIQTKLKKYDYTIGIGVQNASLVSDNILKASKIEQSNIINLFPTARFNYNFGKNRRLNINYRGNTTQPTATQLQPVMNNTNPLNVRIGNPLLKQAFTNNFSLFYNKFNFVSGRTFFTFFNATTNSNKIVDSIANIGPGYQLRKPVNLDGAYNALGNITFGFPIKAIKQTNVNFNSSVFYNRDVNITDGKTNYTKIANLTQSVNINHNYKDKLDLITSFAATYNNTKYTLGNIPNTNYYTYTGSIDVSYVFKGNFTLQSDVDFNKNTGRGDGFNQQYVIWSATASKLFLKDKSLELKLTAFDLLKQNRAINRTIQETYIEDSRSNVLSQYFMLSLRYNLSKFGGKGSKTFTMPKMPGMRGMNNMRIGL